MRPLIKITGETGFNEVLFEDVVVPDTLRLDEVGKGWTVAMTTLTYERGAAEGAGSGGGVSLDERDRAARRAREAHASATACRAGTIRSCATRSCSSAIVRRGHAARPCAARACRRSATTRCACRSRRSSPAASCTQDIARLGVEIAGARVDALRSATARRPTAAHWPLAYMNSYGITIAAGTNEIQRNILGERVLGLAKSK